MFESISNPSLAMLNGWELPAIIGVVLLLFGGAKIPQLMRGLGRGVGEFKKGIEEGKTLLTSVDDEADKPAEQNK